jgi:hypothetical protein
MSWGMMGDEPELESAWAELQERREEEQQARDEEER